MPQFRLRMRLTQNARLRLMAFITIADTGLISYVSTRNLAERWGFGSLSWLYPLCLDAVAAVGMDLWMSESPAKRAARRLTLIAVALSLAANIADWLYVGPGAAVLGAVPPLMLAALLLTLHVHSSGVAARERDQLTASASGERLELPDPSTDAAAPGHDLEPEPNPRIRTRTRTNGGPAPVRPDEELIEVIRGREAGGDQMSKRLVMAEFEVGNDRALRLLHAARNGYHSGLAPTSSSS